MASLSKDTAGIILPFDKFGNHLDAANKNIGINVEIKNFETTGKILAVIWSEWIIDNHPVAASYTSPPEKEHDEVVFHKSEEWETEHVRLSQYMLQIIKCSGSSCCNLWRKNYPVFFHSDSYQLLCQSQHQIMAWKLTQRKVHSVHCFNPFL